MAQILTTDTLMTPEEFWDFCAGRDEWYELVDGKVVEMPLPGPEHGRLDRRLAIRFGGYVEQHQLGEVYLNTGFLIGRQPGKIRGPDQAFVTTARVADNPPPDKGHWEIAPDLAVEIISPGDTAEDVQTKVEEYLQAGVRMAWLVYPKRRQVHVIRPGWEVHVLGEDAVLSGQDVVPGFECSLKELWG